MTIEERAKEYLESEMEKEEFGCGGGLDEIKQAYEQGATDQRKIDIERFLIWFRKRFQDCAEIEWINENCIDFQKSMEE